MPHPHRKNLLTSVQMAHFVATGSLRMDAVVPEEMNQQAIEVLKAGIPGVPYGTPLSEAFVNSEFVQRLVQLPEVAGAIHSLVGPEPTVDHHAVHIRKANEGEAQNLHGETRLVCPAGTVQLLHHGIWHGGRKNDSAIDRYMFKIRFNPTVRQVRLWNIEDLYDEEV